MERIIVFEYLTFKCPVHVMEAESDIRMSQTLPASSLFVEELAGKNSSYLY